MAAESAHARRTLGAIGAALLLLLVSAAPALADVQWRVASAHGPQNMPPGGTGQYMIQAFNVGTTPTIEDYTIEDTLPPGVTATTAYGGWSCPSLPATGTVTCTHGGADQEDVVRPPGGDSGSDARFRGAAATLVLEVTIDPGTSGIADNSVTVSGGDVGAVPGSATEPTPFDTTPAGFGFVPGSFQADVFDAQLPAGSSLRQAGAHPFEMRIDFDTKLKLSTDPEASQPNYTEPDQHIKTLVTKLPPGFLGNPTAMPKCPADRLNSSGPGNKGACPANTQVGSLDLVLQHGSGIGGLDGSTDVPVFNMEPPPGTVAALAVSLLGQPVWIIVTLDPSDYSVVATIPDTIEVYTVRHAALTLWGVPADPAHDPLRVNGDSSDSTAAMNTPFSGAPIKPFLTLPSQCDAPGSVQMRADSWTSPGAFTPWQAGAAATMAGCDDPRFHFDPSITVQPESRTPGTPTALDVDLSVPQKDDTVLDPTLLYAPSGDDRAIPTPPLRNAKVTLPVGMVVSPSSANGLAACSSLQILLKSNAEPTCPDASKIGSVSIDTPLLPDPLTGSIYLAAQNENPFGSMLAIYIVAKGPGVVVKLPGKVVPDPLTGQLTATFDDNPQLPFTKLHLHFDGGPNASLVTPPTCGTKTTVAQFTSWNASLPTVETIDSFPISGDGKGGACAPRGFDPGFVAGTTNPLAGRSSPLVTRITRTDADQELGKVDISLPKGLLGRIASVKLCSAKEANAGTCGETSRIGTVTVGAGPGSDPFFITDGRAYITGRYKGAPFGLSIVVRAKAGPLDLGDVIVRAQVRVDRRTAALRVVSDSLPTILAGIPLQVRVVNVSVDRPGFTFNPTSCRELHATARIESTGGAVSRKRSRFQVGDCATLPFHPRISFRVGGKGHTRANTSTPLVATVRMSEGQANLAGVGVTLPATLNALLPVVNRACTLAEFNSDLGSCRKSKAGSVVAVTPLLEHALRGSAYFVKNPARTLPDLVVALRGQVDVDLTGKVTIPGGRRLATRFDTVPDVPITKFRLRIVDGRNGPLGTVNDLCTKRSRRAKVGIVFRAQSGKVVRRSQRLQVAGCSKHRHRQGGGRG